MSARGRRSSGVYQPRSRKQVFADAMAEARATLARATRTAIFRGTGALVFLIACCGLLALASYSAQDASLDNATGRDFANLFGGFGATAANLMLRSFGIASLAFLAPPAMWGARAMFGLPLSHALWRAAAWPFGTVFLAGGLGLLPQLSALPAGTGGMLGYGVIGLANHEGALHHLPWLGFAVPLLLLIAGFPLAIIAMGLRFRLLWRASVNTAAFFVWVFSLVHWPALRSEDRTEEYEDTGYEPAPPPKPRPDPYALDVKPEPVAATSARDIRVRRDEKAKAAAPAKSARQPALNLGTSEYQLPPLGLLAEPVHVRDSTDISDEALAENARMLEAVLADFGVKGRIRDVRPGPVVTLYEFEPAAGVKSSRVIALADDVARSMSAVAARIAVIPGRNVIGIELPNHHRDTVFLRELLASAEYEKTRAPLILALGKTIGGDSVMADLAKMPHLLIAGTTGSGKSVALNTMILSLLYRCPPDQTKLILIDPKMLELSSYEGIPHLLAPVVTEPKKAVVALKWAVREMEERYRKMSKLGVRGVEAFNERIRKARDKGEQLKRTVQTGFDRDTGKPIYEDEVLELEPMPYIVLVVDEMADLMMISGKEIEGAIQRLAQMARAAGIHLIAATQRPSVDVITGTIKANFPTRISFQVTSKIDSRTILGEQGAEQLLGQGDMLYMMAGGRIGRVHGPFVTEREVEEVVKFLREQGRPEYLDAVTEEPDEDGDDPFSVYGSGNGGSGDDLYDKALDIVARERKATTSYIQRRLEIGYNRAARLIERMEEEGVISRPNHKGLREVLLPEHGER
ncbi:MAG TPA: DNA translocase FtsK 4TM domain-containing protein [Rhizomicrobium sp.]|jgi:S-DNA-T family DNA segregation ATPase FtsK/SpoIIIE